MAISGAIAGLVAITPAAGFVTVPAAIIIGLVTQYSPTLQYPPLKTVSATMMPWMYLVYMVCQVYGVH